MCQFFKKRGYPDSAAITTGKHSAQEINRNTALQSPQNEETNRIPFTLTYHPQNLAVKNVILKNFKILRNDPETQHIFSLAPLISFKRDKNMGNFLVRSAFKSDNQPHHNMTICGLSLHHGNTESRKNLEQKFIFQLGTLYPHGINERLSFH